MGEYIKNKKDMCFKNAESLQSVENVLMEADAALKDHSRNISKSAIPEVLAGAVGIGIGGAASFTALYFAGTVGLSAAGITSGLAAAGALVGGGMVAGIGVLAAPIAILGAVGVGIANGAKNKKLRELKEMCYTEAIKKQNAIIKALERESHADKKRIEYLKSLNILLQSAINDLKHDLGC